MAQTTTPSPTAIDAQRAAEVDQRVTKAWASARAKTGHHFHDAEGEILEHALTKSLRIRNEAIKSLCSSVRRFRDAIKEECKSDYPQASSGIVKVLDRAEDLIQD